MAVDMDRMRKGHEEQQKGGDFLTFKDGETLLYIHPPCRDDDEWEPTSGRNYVPIVVHYGIGKNRGMAVSLDAEKNPIIQHPWVKALLKKQKKRITGDCPVSTALSDGTLADDEADEARAQTRFLWGATALKHRSSSKEPWTDLTPKPGVMFIGKQIFDGLMEVFFDNGDISDPDGAVLCRVKKTGEKRTTKYEVKAEPATLKTPFKLTKSLKAAVAKATTEGGDCDLFRIASNLIKGTAEVQAMLDGTKVDSDPEDFDDDEEEEEKPKKAPRKVTPKAVEVEDDEEEEKPSKKAAKKPAKPADENDEDEDDEEEEPAPKAKGKPAPAAKGKKASPSDDDDDDEDEDDEDDVDEDDDEDDDEPAKPAKGKPAAGKPSKPVKKAPVKADDEDEDDEDDVDDDDEEEEKPSKKPSKAPPAAKGKAKPAADDDDDDIGDLEDALNDLEDEEEEKPKKKGKK